MICHAVGIHASMDQPNERVSYKNCTALQLARRMGRRPGRSPCYAGRCEPLQTACLEHSLPDLSALIIQKPKARSDFGNLLRPSDGWWDLYVTRGETTVGDVAFWFKHFQAARDYSAWPETPFF